MTVEGLTYLALGAATIAGLQIVMAHPKPVIAIGALGLAIALIISYPLLIIAFLLIGALLYV